MTRFFLFFLLGYAIIQIPDFLLNFYAYVEKWIRNRSQVVSNHDNDVTNTPLSPEPLPKIHVATVSRIPGLKMQITKENLSQNQTIATVQDIAELRKETNVKIEKLERILEEINRKLRK